MSDSASPADLIKTSGNGPFPSCNWREITAAISVASEKQQPKLWYDTALRWAQLQRNAFDKFVDLAPAAQHHYRIDQSPHFVVISAFYEGIAAKWPLFGEWALNSLLPFLNPIAIVPPWPIVTIFAHNVTIFDMYVSLFARPNSLVPGGVYFDAEPVPPQMAILGTMSELSLRIVLIHELVHVLIHHLAIPRWLEEGICRHLEAKPLHLHNLYYPADRDPNRNDCWKANSLKTFWSGKCFGRLGAHEAYSLAARMVRQLLAEDETLFFDFVRAAKRSDSGDAACRQFYGMPITSVAAGLLGHGDWNGPETLVHPA